MTSETSCCNQTFEFVNCKKVITQTGKLFLNCSANRVVQNFYEKGWPVSLKPVIHSSEHSRLVFFNIYLQQIDPIKFYLIKK